MSEINNEEVMGIGETGVTSTTTTVAPRPALTYTVKDHISCFKTESEYNKAKDSNKLNTPNISYIKGSNQLHYLKDNDDFIDLSLQDIFGNPIKRTTANCYVVRKSGKYKFPLVYGNAIKNGEYNVAAYTNSNPDNNHFSNFYNHLSYEEQITDPYIYNNKYCNPVAAELTLGTIGNYISDISCNGKEITFTVNSSVSNISGANAIISVVDDMGLIMWSWHIWIWTEDLNIMRVTNHQGEAFDFLSVNLAATTTNTEDRYPNWVYQWGRPMPLPILSSGAGGKRPFGINKTCGLISLRDAIRIPEKYLIYPEGTQPPGGSDTFGYLNLWNAAGNESITIKSIYDPCPVGFCVPSIYAFTGFTTTGKSSNSIEEINKIGDFCSGWYFKRNNKDNTGIFFDSGCHLEGGQGYAVNYNQGLYFSNSRIIEESENTIVEPRHLSFENDSVEILFNRGRSAVVSVSACSIRPVKEKL